MIRLVVFCLNSYFGDSSLSIHYMQQNLYETYNDEIQVTSEYYTTYDMNYGFAHYIAKWLDSRYPILDKQTAQDYKNNNTSSIRDITSPISVANYFLCSNNGLRLSFTPTQTSDEFEQSSQNELYRNIYNKYMIVYKNNETVPVSYTTPYKKYIKNTDLPLFIELDNNSYRVNNNSIFTLSNWSFTKKICEIDDYVASYLLGRTIGPNSSMEDIYYAQRLLIRDRNITDKERGIWCLPEEEGTVYDMTQTIINYQKQRVTSRGKETLFVTGYFDIFTEGFVLREVGENINGILGL